MQILRENIQNRSVLVVGDSMLDEYWYGDATRISPEAPVPVVRVSHKEERLGGAANVAANISMLGSTVQLLTVVGDDAEGHRFKQLLEKFKINSLCQVDESIKTTLKLRVVAQNQQLLRIDFEKSPNKEVLSNSLIQYKNTLPAVDVVVLSDYGKGGLTHISEMIAEANRQNIPIFVDPKGSDYSKYAGATVITPNLSELRQVIGGWESESELHIKAENLRKALSLQYLLLTRGADGVTLFSASGVFSVPAQAKEVFDVSGAGDTVIAVLATLISAGVPFRDAVEYANKAGGIVVGKFGTSSITFDELFC